MKMQYLLKDCVCVQLSSQITLLDPERILNSYYSHYQALPAQWGLQQPYQKPARNAVIDSSAAHEVRSASSAAPLIAIGCKRPLAPAAMPHIENHPEVADSQIADSCNSCRQLQQSNPAERQSEPTEQQIIPLGIQMTQQAHTKLVSAIACAVQTSANVAAAGAAVCSPEGDPAETAGAPSAGSDQAAGHGLSSAADWLALAAMKHVLKPRISFSCTDQHGGQLQVDSKLFNAVVHNPGNTEIVAAAYDKDVLLPAHSSFCMSDLKGIKPFVEAVRARGSADLLIIDPPWENASATRAAHYQTLTPNHLLYIPVQQLMKQVFIVDAVLMLQQPGSLLALWMTNRPRHHRFVHEKLFPAWGVVHVATWYWLKVTNAGDPVSPLHSLHRHPFEQLWLARVGVQQGIEQLTTGGQPESAGLQTPVTAVVTESLRPIIVAQASQCPADADVPDNPEQGEQLQGDCRQEPDTSVSNQCMPAAEAASGANISRATHPPDQHVVISVPGQHSRKPHLQQLLLSYVLVIDSEAPGTQPSQLQQPCIAELFARELFRGGMAWGNEVLKFQEISGNWKKMV